MEPRGFWGTLTTTSAALSLLFTLLLSSLFSLVMGVSFGFALPFGIWIGIAFGVSFGFTTAFLLKVKTVSVVIQNRKTFVARMNIKLAELDYHPEHQFEDFWTYKPSFQAGLLAGRLSIQLEQHSATIIGPSVYVNKLRKRIQ
ncbi:MAG: hypothetical protein ACTS2F_14805 [Thainema sp.]